jgi:hypothetical protein
MARYMPLKFPVELRQPLMNKQLEIEATVRQIFRKPKRVPFTYVLKAVLENKTFIPDEYIKTMMGIRKK